MSFPFRSLAMALIALFPTFAQADLIPERRIVPIPDTDLPGGDIDRIFDTSLDACINACVSNTDCAGLTYNLNARACFPKATLAEPAPFTGALSGRVEVTPQSVLDRAKARRTDASFLTENDISTAYAMARDLAARSDNLPGASAEAARYAESQNDLRMAAQYRAALAAQTDSAADWAEMARLTLYSDGDNSAAASMAANAYLRADNNELAAQSLQWLAMAWERNNRGRDGLIALRLAGTLSTSPEITEALNAAEARYSFRITDTVVEPDGLTPQICAVMSGPLDESIDYMPFVHLPDRAMTVEASGDRLCVGGLTFGQDVAVTLRAGMPGKDGDTLARNAEMKGYIRDRAPSVRFGGRAYVLPSGGDQGLSVTTVNADTLDLRLSRVSDRNLLRTMRDNLFGRPLDAWRVEYFNDEYASEIWKGQADVAKPAGQSVMNRDLTTRLAIPQAAGPLEPGIYVLQASVAGKPVEDTGMAAQWFVISDFGISTLSGVDGMTVAVRSLGDAGPKPGAEVQLISRGNAVLATVATDADGFARFPEGATRGEGEAAPALVTVTDWQGEGANRAPADMAFLSLSDPEFDLSDRGVTGLPPAPPIDVFLTTDRGAYRAGETANATILTRNTTARAIDGLPLTAVIYRPDGVEFSRQMPQPAGAGGYTLAFAIPDTAPRGSWRIDLRAEAEGATLASSRILVEDFLPERIDFTLELPEGVMAAGTETRASLSARWLFGAPAGLLPVEGYVRLAPALSLPGFDGFRFGRADEANDPVIETLPPGQTDENGDYATLIALPEGGTGAQEATISLNVREGAGRPVERSETRMLMPQSPVLGIKPQFENDTIAENSEARFQVVAVGADMQPASMPVRWVLNAVDTRYQWYSIDGDWNWEPIISRRKITEGVADLHGGPVEIAAPVEWGEYEMVVEPASGAVGGAASSRFWAGWGASGESDTPDKLTVTLDKPAYKSGDTAQVKVKALASGQALVSVLSNRVIDLRVVAVNEGENTISLPVTDDWGAGVYVTVSAIRPVQGEAGRVPVRALGLAHAAVDPGDRKLSASIEVPEQAKPRGTVPVTLNVSGADGETVYATIAAVDQGILNLTAFKSPDPSAHYFGQRRLGVGLRDLYGRLILPSGAPDGAIREGGDDSSGATMAAPPPTERLMAWFSGPLTVQDGKATVEVPIPDFNGEIRLMAVVWSGKAVGQAEAKLLVRDPVVTVVTAPRFLAPGDSAQITLALTHASGPAGEVKLAVAGEGVNLNPGNLPGSVTLAEGATQRVTLPLRADTQTGVGTLHLTVTTPDGQALTKDIAVPVMMGEPEQSRKTRVTLAAGTSISLDPALTADYLPGAQVVMASGGFGMLDVAGALGALDRYPYGCTEQTTSRAMPLLYLSDLSALLGGKSEPEIAGRIDEAIAKVLTRQSASGAFGMWSPSAGDLWLDAYVTDFLSRARVAGHTVPEQSFKTAITNLQNRVNYAAEPQYSDQYDNAALAYAVSVLARERAATVGDLRYYADTAADSFKTPMSAAQIGGALASYGDQARADRMFARAQTLLGDDVSISEEQIWRSDYGSNLRDRAAVLAIAVEAGSNAVDLQAQTLRLADQIERRGRNSWGLSTQEMLWTTLAAHALSNDPGGVTVNGAAISRAVADLPAGAVVANTGARDVELTLTAFGYPAGAVEKGGRGYTITRSYYTHDGTRVDPATVALGTRMVAVIDVTPLEGGAGRVLVNDPLPAGFEIDNPNLIRAGDIAALDWLDAETDIQSVEFRQDRFTAALDRVDNTPFRLAYMLRAVTQGDFRHPAASVEDMYRPEYRAWTDGGRVTVAPEG